MLEGPGGWAQPVEDPILGPSLVEALQSSGDFTVGTFKYDDAYNYFPAAMTAAEPVHGAGNGFIANNRKHYAKLLKNAIQCLADRSGKKVSLVGYSRGG